MKRAGEEAKKNKTKLVLYPEGTRNTGKNLNLLPFKKGGFHVALDGKLPILPVVVSEYEFLKIDKNDVLLPCSQFYASCDALTYINRFL